MTTKLQIDQAFMEAVFPDKPQDKREKWMGVLHNEEFTTVDDLRDATDVSWKELNLPVGVKDALRRFIGTAAAPPTTGGPGTSAGGTSSMPGTTTSPPGTTAPATTSTSSSTPEATTVATTSTSSSSSCPEPDHGDQRPITQIDVIAFDVSGSMKSDSFDREKTRAEVGKILFQAMIDKYAGAELPHAIGLLTFGSRLDFTPFTRDCTKFEGALGELDTSQGSTKLYDAIYDAAMHIENFRKSHSADLHPECLARVFCLTDGDDTSSSRRHWEVAAELVKRNIVLDAFPLAGANNWLQAMAATTGGLCLAVSQVAQGIGLFEREALLRVSCRDPPAIPPSAPRSEGDLSRLFNTQAAQGVSDVKSVVPKQATAPVLVGAYEVALAARAASTTTTKRVFKELRDLLGQPTPIVAGAWVNADDCMFWKVLIEGPTGTPYEGCRWMLSIQFPGTYPANPPQVRFIVPIYHCNMSSDGRICLDLLSTAWNPALSISRILTAIKTLMEHPNGDDPLDTYKATLFKEDKARYTREAREHSRQYASRSVHDVCAHFKIAASS
ncbi:Ubiquitin-conjugating enzyme E2 4 [Pelomyxa schiedti]|nr:Ubiquitin-conjugating enzyme E2 4 [Pelomyxa schiedti]